jgi:hypothetical protein
MATKPTFEEVLRYVVEAKGDEDIGRLAQQILSLGEASDQAKDVTAQLLQEFSQAKGLAAAAERFRALGTSITELTGDYTRTQAQLKAVAEEIASAQEPTRKQQAEFKRLSRELESTGSRLSEARQQWREQRDVLEEAGVSTKRSSTIQSQVADVQARAAGALKDYARDLINVQQAQKRAAEWGDRLRNSVKDQGRETLNAAADLKQYEQRAAAATRETKELATEAEHSSGVMSKLRAAAGAVFAFFSVDKLVDGIKAVISEGSRGEQELAQLEAAIASTGRQAEYSAEQLDQMAGSVARGLFDKGDITSAQTRLLTYTNIVGDMFPRALQISIDQAQRLGISIESSSELIGRALQTPSKAMEALGRQGFVLEESQKALIKQLEATGRTAEAQAIIMDLLVESYGGAAAAASTNTILGLWERLRETWRNWQEDVANRGVLDYFKDQIRQILETTKRLADDGTLGRWAQQTADTIVRLSEALKAGTRWLFEHRDAIVFMAKAYAALKIGGAIVQMNQWRLALKAAALDAYANAAAVDKVSSSSRRLGTILRAIPTSLKIGVALVGVEVAIEGAKALARIAAENSDIARQTRELQARVNEQIMRMAAGYADGARSLEGFAHQAVLTKEQVAALSDEERRGYAERAEGLKRYLVQLNTYYLAMQEAGALTPTMARDWEEVRVRLDGVKSGIAAIPEGIRLAADALRNEISPAAQAVVDKLTAVARSGEAGRNQLRELFASLDFNDNGSLEAVALAIGSIAGQSAAAERAVRDGLAPQLDALAGEDLLRFQSAATAAFAAFQTEPEKAAAVLDSTLLAGLNKLGVSVERTGLAFTRTSRDAVASFSAIAENARSTGDQVEMAFRAALNRVTSKEDAQALGAALRSAGEQGKIGFEASERAAGALATRLRQIQVAMDPLADEFAALGIKSQESLDASRDAAKSSFDAIRKAAATGKASIEDVRRAFAAYSQAARDSVADSDASAKSRVEGELAVLDAVYRVNDGLGDMGQEGRAAGAGVAAGAGEATEALNQTAAAAERGRQAMLGGGAAAEKLAEGQKQAAAEAMSLSFSMGEVSDTFRKLMKEVFQSQNPLGAFGTLARQLSDQQAEFAKVQEQQQATLKGYDALEGRRKQLRQQFSLIGDSQLEQLLQTENQITQAKQAQADKIRQQQEDERRANEARLSGLKQESALMDRVERLPMSDSDNKFVIELQYPQPAGGGELSAEERRFADRLLRYLLPKLMTALTRMRSVSVVQRPRR